MNRSIQVEYLLETIIDSMKNDTRTSKNDNRAKRGKECVINIAHPVIAAVCSHFGTVKL